MSKMCNRLFIFAILLSYMCICFCQDFEPDPLFPKVEETTTAEIISSVEDTSENIEVSATTDRPLTTTSIQEPVSTSTLSPISTSTPPTTTLEISTEGLPITTTSITSTTSTNDIEQTTAKTSSTESLETTTESIQTEPMTSTTTSSPTTTSPPYQKCYFRKQQSVPKFYWTCEGPKWLYSMECYQCCQSENSDFAGCSQVHYSHCEEYF